MDTPEPNPTAGGSPLRRPFVLRNRNFAAFWIGQTASLVGDRISQVTLAVMVYAATGSPLATSLTFLTTVIPNILFGPFVGPFVDRFERRRVLIASDLARAAIVATIPFVAAINLWFVFPLVFATTSFGLLFRPAKAAFLPLIVDREDLVPANGAINVSEALADIGGYPLAGILVAVLGPLAPLAFFVDAASYLMSALSLATIPRPTWTRPQAVSGDPVARYLHELREGWGFLRHDAPLWANTMISVPIMAAMGATNVLIVIYARQALEQAPIAYPVSYGILDTAIGIGALLAGVVVTFLAVRIRLGRLFLIGYAIEGVAFTLQGLTSNLLAATAFIAGSGVGNVIGSVPTQALFGERVSDHLFGRVVSARMAIIQTVYGVGMISGGIAATFLPVGITIVGFGLLTLAAVAVGATRPAITRV
jgi:MFS family permease